MKNQFILGFDYGEKRIGVAVGQTITRTASPLVTVYVRNNKPDWRDISQLVDKWKPGLILVGVPLQMNGEHQPMTAAAEKFIRQLSSRYHLPVKPVDERLSSFEARRRTGSNKKIDPVAAQIIIETWLYERERMYQKHQHQSQTAANE